MLFYAIFLMMANSLNRNAKLQQENHFLSLQQARYNNLRTAIEEARQARHDMRHHFHQLSALAEDGNLDKIKEYEWSDYFSFDKLNIKKNAEKFIEFKNRATQALNENMDVILAVSKRVYDIAIENNILEKKLVLSYIGTRVAEFQVGKSNCKCGKYFKIGYLGSNLDYEEKGYPFLLSTLESMDMWWKNTRAVLRKSLTVLLEK